MLVNFEAIDRGGKTTQVKLIEEALAARGISVCKMSFPDTPSRSKEPSSAHYSTGVLIERDLDGELALVDLRDSIFRIEEMRGLADETRELIVANIREKLVQLIFSINRRERAEALREAIETNDVVLVGRYLSAFTYGVANGVSRLQVAALEGDLPQPDVTFLLDLDPAAARGRRSDESYDRYESDAELQAKVSRLYSDLVRDDADAAAVEKREPAFVRLDATEPAEVIAAKIVAEIVRRLGRRRRMQKAAA